MPCAMNERTLQEKFIIIRGAGEMATGVACRLYRANFTRMLMLETHFPLAVRRRVSFCEAIHDEHVSVEGIEAFRIERNDGLSGMWESRRIPVRIDPQAESIRQLKPDVVVDATLAKRNLGTAITDAPLVIALGPGFCVGTDCHVVIETNRGHDLGRLITHGSAATNTGIPGDIGGYTLERVLRAPADGMFIPDKKIGEMVRKGEVVGRVGELEVVSAIGGILRGLIRPGSVVTCGLKIGDVDPRGEVGYCNTVSEKARALGGAVLEAVLAKYNR
ncbi:MAG: EF2563 family selenium-dependent molybdenum hydroxylase system protein [Betaproteobacteria bacterium]|nr:EF2563 family selenium-dependent molybdenum hydroxylase system protein [Betaproteobacteria bacterium]